MFILTYFSSSSGFLVDTLTPSNNSFLMFAEGMLSGMITFSSGISSKFGFCVLINSPLSFNFCVNTFPVFLANS